MKKLLLLAIAALFYMGARAHENDPLVMIKPNGERILAIKGGVLNIAGFEINLGDEGFDHVSMNPYCDTLRYERKMMTADTTPGREIFVHAYLPRHNEEGNMIWVSRTNYAYQGDPWRYDSVVVSNQNDTLYRYSSAQAPVRYIAARVCGCGKVGCTCRTQQTQPRSYTNVTIHKTKTRTTSSTLNFDFGFIGLHGDPEFMKLNHGKSINISVDFRRNRALNPAKTVWFSMGLRARHNNYVFRDEMTLGHENENIVAVPLEHNRRFKKSKLLTGSLDVPVAFRFRIARAIRLETGVYGGITVGDRTKIKFPKEKDRGDWRTNFWQAGATVRLRVKPLPFGVFGTYSFTPLFENGAGPRVNPFTIGLYL